MAAILAVAATDNWNSNGSWVGNVQPTAADDVTIVAGANVTIPSGVTALARSVTVAGTGTLTFAATTSTLTIGDGTAGAGNVAFSNAGTITLTAIGTINFISTSATVQTITSGGQTMPNMTFNAASNGSWKFSDNQTSTGTLTLTKGTLDTNSKATSVSIFSNSGTSTRTITQGSTAWTCSSTATPWNFRFSGLTVTSNTATVAITGAAATLSLSGQNGGNYNGTSFTMSGGGAQTLAVTNLAGTTTVANLTIAGTAVTTDSVAGTAGSTLVVTGTLSLGGNTTQGINRLLMGSSTSGSAFTFSCSGAATVITGDVDFQDITLSGSPSWTNAGSAYVGNCLGNSGLTLTTTAAQTHSASAGGNWSDATKWTSRVPLPQDNVIVDGNTTGTITANMPRLGANLTFTGFAGGFTAGNDWVGYGNLTWGSGMSTPSGGSHDVTLAGRGSQTITSNGKNYSIGSGSAQFIINGPGGTYTLADAFSMTGSSANNVFSALTNFDAATYNMIVRDFSSNTSNTRTINLNGSTIDVRGVAASTVWNILSTNLTMTASTATILISTVSTGVRTFAGGGQSYGTLTYTVAGSTHALVISGSNTFGAINFSDVTNARILTLTAGTTQTITNGANFSVNGTSGKLMTLNSSSAGTKATLAITTGTVNCDYLAVVDNDASVTTPAYCGANGTISNTTNWNATAPPSGGASHMMLMGMG